MAARSAASRRSIGCVTRMPLRCVCCAHCNSARCTFDGGTCCVVIPASGVLCWGGTVILATCCDGVWGSGRIGACPITFDTVLIPDMLAPNCPESRFTHTFSQVQKALHAIRMVSGLERKRNPWETHQQCGDGWQKDYPDETFVCWTFPPVSTGASAKAILF